MHMSEGTTTETGPKDITMTTTTRPGKPDNVTNEDRTKDINDVPTTESGYAQYSNIGYHSLEKLMCCIL